MVVFDVQRGGPSTGMPTRTQQSDILLCAFASHGDTKHVLLSPRRTRRSLRIRRRRLRFRRAVADADVRHARPRHRHEFASDEPFRWDDKRRYDRGKVMTAEELERMPNLAATIDVDGDGIPWRTLPGAHPTRGAYLPAAPAATGSRAIPKSPRPMSTTWNVCCTSSRPRAVLLPAPWSGAPRNAPRSGSSITVDRARDGRSARHPGGEGRRGRRLENPRLPAQQSDRRLRRASTKSCSSSSRIATGRCVR